jgi:hypothetical protein
MVEHGREGGEEEESEGERGGERADLVERVVVQQRNVTGR